MRVIAGSAKGTTLRSPGGLKIRPTSGKVKEAFFNILGNRVLDAFFLDLFSGIGGMGIEALSRGSSFSVFVEKERKCVKIIEENLKQSRLFDRAAIFRYDVHIALKLLSKKGFRFDIVYLDPPYLYTAILKLICDLDKFDLLVPGGVLGIERDSRDLTKWVEFSPFPFWQRKKYGNTQLVLFQNMQ